MPQTDFQSALIAIQMEHIQMPALTLTPIQIARLCTLPVEICQAALETLVAAGFLRKSDAGRFAAVGTAPVSVEYLDPLTWMVSRVPETLGLAS